MLGAESGAYAVFLFIQFSRNTKGKSPPGEGAARERVTLEGALTCPRSHSNTVPARARRFI